MLTYSVMPSLWQGEFLVVYATPGLNTPTVAGVFRTEARAIIEADFLNSAQGHPDSHSRMSLDLEGEH